MNFLNTIVYKRKLSKTKKHFGFRLYKPTIWTALVLTNLQFSKELSKGKPFVICEIQVNLKSTSYIEATNKHIQDVIVNHDIIRSLTEENTRKSSAILIDKLIDWID